MSKEQSNMDNPEKLVTYEDKQEYNTLCVGHHYTQANTNNVIKTWALPQTTEGKDERKILSCGNRNGLHNTELRTYMYIIGQHKKLKRCHCSKCSLSKFASFTICNLW